VIPRASDWWNAYEQKREAWEKVEKPTTVVSV
jgi:hypothetical protein